jgi:hypothetical protein
MKFFRFYSFRYPEDYRNRLTDCQSAYNIEYDHTYNKYFKIGRVFNDTAYDNVQHIIVVDD